MITYAKNELISSTHLSRNLGSILSMLRTKELNKVAVLRNNDIEAVLISLEEYEKIMELTEHIEIANIIE